MSSRSDAFLADWVSRTVQNIPGLEDQLGEHIHELIARLRGEASAAGISADELDETMGDAEDYLMNAYEQVQDPTLGFHESD